MAARPEAAAGLLELAPGARRRSAAAAANRIKMSRELMRRLALALAVGSGRQRAASPPVPGAPELQVAEICRRTGGETPADANGGCCARRPPSARLCKAAAGAPSRSASPSQLEAKTGQAKDCDFIAGTRAINAELSRRAPDAELISSYEQTIDWRQASFLSLTLQPPAEQIKAGPRVRAQQMSWRNRKRALRFLVCARTAGSGFGLRLRRRRSCCGAFARPATSPGHCNKRRRRRLLTSATSRRRASDPANTCCCCCCCSSGRGPAYKRRLPTSPGNCLPPEGSRPPAAYSLSRMPVGAAGPDNKFLAREAKRQMQMSPGQARRRQTKQVVVFLLKARSRSAASEPTCAGRPKFGASKFKHQPTSSNRSEVNSKNSNHCQVGEKPPTGGNKKTKNLNASSILQKPYGTNKTNYKHGKRGPGQQNVAIGSYFNVKLHNKTASKLKTKIRARTRSSQSVIIKQIPLAASNNNNNQLASRRPEAQAEAAPGAGLKLGRQADLCFARPVNSDEPARPIRVLPEALPAKCAQGLQGQTKAVSELSNCDIVDRRACGPRRRYRRFDSRPELGRRRASWLASLPSSILWLACFLLASSAQVRPSSAQSTSNGPAGLADSEPDSTSGEELSRAVLATMSTQPPALEPALNSTAAFGRFKPSAPPFATAIATGSDTGMGAAVATSAGQPADKPEMVENELQERILSFLRIFIMSAIIIGDICGNSLVILSVCRHSKLRVTTNWFVVSLACADILVALFAMTFNASVIISGRWLFKPWVCDFWNSCDVLASTASILHLCCISIDRYVAIMRPLDYPMKITTRRVMYTLCAVWISSALLSYLPIFTGVYTTQEHIEWQKLHPEECEFVVNRVYAIVSSSISFWIPCCIMIFVYYRIFREATRQEKFIYKAQSMMPAPMANHHHGNHHAGGGNNCGKSSAASRAKQRRSKSVAVSGTSGGAGGSSEARIRNLAKQQQEMQARRPLGARQQQLEEKAAVATTKLTASTASIPAGRSASGASSEAGGASSDPLVTVTLPVPAELQPLSAPAPPAQPEKPAAIREEAEEDEEDSNSGQSTPTNRSISKMKREHKAAKTLGIIMGVFILCWLPFFIWYTPTQICGRACDQMVPKQAVTILFWIGYFNSTLNPIIYAYFNHEFRDAFKKTLQWIFCCCNDLKCLRVNRPNDNQHYNCTYRSTQEIGLVNS